MNNTEFLSIIADDLRVEFAACMAEGAEKERERIKSVLLEKHELDKHLHNYWSCLAVELFGPNVGAKLETTAPAQN